MLHVFLLTNFFLNTVDPTITSAISTLDAPVLPPISSYSAPRSAAATRTLADTTSRLSAQANVLLRLLLLLASPGLSIHTELLRRIAFRRRWAHDGSLDTSPSLPNDLAPDVAKVIGNALVFDRALLELVREGATLTDPTNSRLVTVDTAIRSTLVTEMYASASEAELAAWKCQALIVACLAVPFKYLQPGT